MEKNRAIRLRRRQASRSRSGVGPARDGADDGPGADVGTAIAQAVAAMGGVGRQALSRPDGARHVVGRAPASGLPQPGQAPLSKPPH